MGKNAFVCWAVHQRSWEAEHDLIGSVNLPLIVWSATGLRRLMSLYCR
jgi:hypothetical protein